LVREAGGFITDIDGGDAILQKGNVVAGNEPMHRELLRLLREAAKAEQAAATASTSP
jgi:myo-inositol-1(or 4)-monophosphatase